MTNLEAVGIWGASGYVGTEIKEILAQHPFVDCVYSPGDEVDIDTAFLALPHGHSVKLASELHKKGIKVIDSSSDHRFSAKAAYGLPEYNAEAITKADIVAMPGCYPTVALLSMLPLIENELVDEGSTFVINAISGFSGAGKKPSDTTHAMNIFNNIKPYKTGQDHQHVPEMKQFLGGHEILFSPKLGPYPRGILAETSATLKGDVSLGDVQKVFIDKYQNKSFVKVLPDGQMPDIYQTVRTDLCALGLVVVGNTVQILGSIDNLRKGAASQAVQAFNCMHGYEETAGLIGK